MNLTTLIDTIIVAHRNVPRTPSQIYLRALSDLGRLSDAVSAGGDPEDGSGKARIVTAALDLLVTGVALLRTQVPELSDEVLVDKTLFRPALVGYASNVLAEPPHPVTRTGLTEAIAESLFMMRHPQDTDPENEDVELNRGHQMIRCCILLIRSEFREITAANLILMLGKDPAARAEMRRAENGSLAASLRRAEVTLCAEGRPMVGHALGKAADLIFCLR